MTNIQNNLSKGSIVIESINPRKISEKDLEKIAEIEQDMWARDDWIGEYVKCESCNKIHSKEDIFWHLTKDIKIQTVKKIEEIIDFDIVCLDCGSEVKSIYDRNEYIESIRSRYNDTIESFLTVYRDDTGEIRGFMDWYIDNFSNVYNREFKAYYDNIWLDIIDQMIKQKLNIDRIPYYILSCSSLGIENKYANFLLVLKLMQSFFYSIDEKWRNILWITELEIGSYIHNLHTILGTIQLWITNESLSINNKNMNFNSDIFIHPTLIQDYKEALWIPLRKFISMHKNAIKWF